MQNDPVSQEREQRVTALLIQTEEAHGAYEQLQLGGVYDTQWPIWYAAFAVAHGLADILRCTISEDALSRFFSAQFVDFTREHPRQTWAEYTAVGIVERFSDTDQRES